MRTGGHPERSWDVQDTILGDLGFELITNNSNSKIRSVIQVRPKYKLSSPQGKGRLDMTEDDPLSS